MEPLRFGVFVTVALAVVCWAVGETFRRRAVWGIGAALMLVHAALAFAAFYGWSHGTAQRLTMEQTAALTGIQFGGGIYVNYAFLAVWIGDALWWCTSPSTYAARSRTVSGIVRGFIFFIIFNGAVVFADGFARVLGIACTLLVVWGWTVRRDA